MAEVERSGVAGRLRFVHSLSDVEVAALYRGATLFVYPSHYEGFGFAPLQALAAGVPVVASSAGSLPEVLGDAALFVDPRSVDEIAGGIVRLLTDAAAAGELAARGARQAARYRWDAAARTTLDAFRQVAGQRLQPALAL
jgi:glycosyltransferase involved in cell wall biosynthesis